MGRKIFTILHSKIVFIYNRCYILVIWFIKISWKTYKRRSSQLTLYESNIILKIFPDDKEHSYIMKPYLKKICMSIYMTKIMKMYLGTCANYQGQIQHFPASYIFNRVSSFAYSLYQTRITFQLDLDPNSLTL